MHTADHFLSPSEAARRLGISAKALRHYERRGLVIPLRSAAGWRTYGPDQIARAAEIAALRALGFNLTQVARVLGGDAKVLEQALAMHQNALEGRVRDLTSIVARVRDLRIDLAQGKVPRSAELARLVRPSPEIRAAFDLPWPWGGEWFEMREVRALNYIIGPLGSGKTRLARHLAETLPNAKFLGLERLADAGAEARMRLTANPILRARVEQTMDRLVDDGATASDALVALLAGLEAEGVAHIVVDMVEQGLDHVTQEALIAHVRARRSSLPSLFLLTRSSAILDLTAVGPSEAIILCPANHSPPFLVAPFPGAPGYEAVSTCLATPEVRARTEGTIAWRPQVA